MSIGLKTLVLNADMMPVNALTMRANQVEQAIVRVLNGTCFTVATYDRVFSTAGGKHHIPVPSVMARTKYFKRPETVPYNKQYILLRDNYKCVYCSCPLSIDTLTYDHYIPKAKGGRDGWNNYLASCGPCNHNYGDTDAKNKKPRHKPYTPSYSKLVSLRRKYPITLDHESWVDFIQPWKGEITIKDVSL